MVTHRQQPATAKGMVFLNLEDETGLVNVICTPDVWKRFRKVARTAPALEIRGLLERTRASSTCSRGASSRSRSASPTCCAPATSTDRATRLRPHTGQSSPARHRSFTACSRGRHRRGDVSPAGGAEDFEGLVTRTTRGGADMGSMPRRIRAAGAVLVTLALAVIVGAASSGAAPADRAASSGTTSTPIKHLVVIFQENVSFDHYFGTYPNAANTERPAVPRPSPARRRERAQPAAADREPQRRQPAPLRPVEHQRRAHLRPGPQLHRRAARVRQRRDGQVPRRRSAPARARSPTGSACVAGDVMNYYDGNTVTALWNYAQHFAMSDNSFGTTFGPSSPGAINLVVRQHRRRRHDAHRQQPVDRDRRRARTPTSPPTARAASR